MKKTEEALMNFEAKQAEKPNVVLWVPTSHGTELDYNLGRYSRERFDTSNLAHYRRVVWNTYVVAKGGNSSKWVEDKINEGDFRIEFKD